MPEVAFRSDVAVFDIGPIFRFDLSLALEARGNTFPSSLDSRSSPSSTGRADSYRRRALLLRRHTPQRRRTGISAQRDARRRYRTAAPLPDHGVFGVPIPP